MHESDSAAVDEPIQKTIRRRRKRDQKRPKRQPRYNVVLWNDDDHTYGYVIVMLMQLFGYPAEKGYQLVLTTTKEHAELKRDQIHAFGKDGLIENCKGSMSASIEPVDGE